jgi:uncharacterized protein YdiU (UPF0061 family)
MNTCGFNFDNSYLRLPELFYSRQNPTAVAVPELVIFNDHLVQQMGLDFSMLGSADKSSLFAGNLLPPNSEPIAQAYAGHQFGHFTMLGDGRAVLLGEHVAPNGERFDIQLKGAGQTPYSRRGDGRAALAPMLREYLISEAMFHLGIPTTRSLAVVKTGEWVMRNQPLPGAVLTRVASSHIRVGTFEFVAATRESSEPSLVSQLLDYTICRHYPELINSEEKALDLFNAVMERQADLIVAWMRVGFIHGVMNTDNMTLSGQTIDYGPCAFMDVYDPNTVFSSIDRAGRYAYGNQPNMAQWNLARLAESLLSEMHPDIHQAIEIAQPQIARFATIYQEKWLMMMRSKLGLLTPLDEDTQLIADLLNWMALNQADFTNTFRQLSTMDKPQGKSYEQESFNQWHVRWLARLAKNNFPIEESMRVMKSHNPAVIPRNHQVEKALSAAETGDMQPFMDLLAVLEQPYQESAQTQIYQQPPEPSQRVYQTFCGT